MRFVLIDGFLELQPGKRARAVKTFREGDELFLDHFPGFPVVPGVLITEAMGQTGGWLVAASLDFARWPFLTLVERAKFRRFLRPEQTLELEASVEEVRGDDYVIKAHAEAGGERVAEARLVLHAEVLSAMPSPDPSRFQEWARQTFARLMAGKEALCA